MVTDDHVSTLRAYLTDDWQEYDRLTKRLDETGSWSGYGALFGSAFFDAVNRKFAPTWTVAGVIRFVATVRARYVEDPDQLDPRAAERLIQAALGAGSTAELDDEIKSAQLILLPALIDDERPDAAALEDILILARERAVNLPM